MIHLNRLKLAAGILAGLASSFMTMNAEKITYPKAPADPSVSDQYFGITVADPYRPLENDTAAETLEWVKAENAVTQDYLSRIPFRDKIRQRLTALNDYEKPTTPSKEKDGYYYFYKNDGLQNQSVLYRTRDLRNGTPEVFLDPNTLSEDGTVALNGVQFSNDGRYVSYSISRSGSDWNEFYVIDSATKTLLPDHVEWAKFGSPVWHGDGFYYSAYARPEAGKEFSNANENHRVYYHRLGTPQEEDILIYEDPDHPLHFHSVGISDDESCLFLFTSGAGIGNGLKIKNLTTPDATWLTIEEGQDYYIEPIDIVDGRIYLFTSKDAPKYRIVAAPADNPLQENWTEIVPETDAVLTAAQFAADNLILTYDKDAAQHAYIADTDGNIIREIQLPTYGTVYLTSSRSHPEVFYKFTSFTYPGSIYSYDIATGESTLLTATAPQGFQPDDYITEQVFYTSKDGTRVPMFITYKKGLRKDGSNPVYLYGYGGFNIALNPGFTPNRLFWLENGGIYAQANLRGGSEYGEEWHKAGTKMQKQNVFDDFIAAAEYMISEGWTSPELLTIEGGSNGGLLVGAVTNQRPELFRVAIPRVGVMDMMRYHLFTIGWNWAPDYGTSADSPEMAAYLLGYSPTHNIKNDGTPYPAILVTTADHDDRVVPAHSFKYAATLQSADTGDRPKLIRIDSKAGHGAGKPIGKVIDEYADIYSFIFQNIGKTY
ncbi:MAG: S9 family peptidase [Muribaculaceae bacterium]|nr:S9 family peptidase [Muribaculaceae bacterium]